MIFHISVPVEDPKHVAKVVGEIVGGPVVQFVPAPDSYFVFSHAGDGVGVEFIPRRLTHVPGAGDGESLSYEMSEDAPPTYSGSHLAMASQKSAKELIAIAEREGWRCVECWRATAFPLVEMWLENHYMVEWFPPEIAQTYVDFSTPENWRKYFNLKLDDGVYLAQQPGPGQTAPPPA